MTHGGGGVECWIGTLTVGVSIIVLPGLGCKYVKYSRAGGVTAWNEVLGDKDEEILLSLVAWV